MANGKKTETLLHELMVVDIIIDKKIVKCKKIAPSMDDYSMLSSLINHQSLSRFTTLVPIFQKDGV